MRDERAIDLDEAPPASPAEALAIIDREQARHAPGYAPYFLIWGIGWLVIGMAWFGATSGSWSTTLAGIATAAVVVVGVATSAVIGARSDRGVNGPSRTGGAMYGIGWMTAMIATGAAAAGIARFVAPEQLAAAHGAIMAGLFVLVAGVIYTISGASWRSPIDYGLGIGMQGIAVATVFTPSPWNMLVMGIGGGGALIVVGLLRVRR